MFSYQYHSNINSVGKGSARIPPVPPLYLDAITSLAKAGTDMGRIGFSNVCLEVKESSSPVREEAAAASEMPQTEEHPASLEDLKVELSSLKTHMELLRAQHRRDMEELKEQLCQEQSKRAALEAEIVQLKHTLAHGCRTVISGDRAPSLSAASPAPNSWLPAISTKDC
ncbi:UNVERIFIED_CONTAM: hypothetical protein K2H54_044295 [Gekko kuhli]